MSIRQILGLTLLHRLEPERAHRLTLSALKAGLAPAAKTPDDPALAIDVFGLAFPNPLGLAAGFDKDAEAIGPLLAQGLGFVEVGTVTPRPQPGNARPRVFRLAEDRAIVNRLGFNSGGLEAAERNLAAWREKDLPGIVGVNLGKNKDSADAAADYAEGARRLGPYADYLTINVSSPNTPGLRALQGRGALTALVDAVNEATAKLPARPPVLVKIAPDMSEADLDDVCAVARESGIAGNLAGLIVSNTTVSRPEGLKSPHAKETGGLSGRPLFALSTEVLRQVYARLDGSLPLVGVGGVSSGTEAYAKVRAGASLVQLYTGLVYEGPALIGAIKQEMAGLLAADGFTRLAEAVGADHR